MQGGNDIITVGIPIYASPIVWLAMEGLCRQKNTCKWELIIYEDEEQALGIRFYKQYLKRLSKVNCVSFHYKYSKERTALSKKWCVISQLANEKSIGIILQAADCFSEPNRIQTSFDKMSEGIDWMHSAKGIFYYIQRNKTIEFNIGNLRTGLNMCMNTELVRQIPIEEKWSSIDNWLLENILKLKPNLKIFTLENNDYLNGIDTDGFNRISLKRKENYSRPKPPFKRTFITADRCLPIEIYQKLRTWRY